MKKYITKKDLKEIGDKIPKAKKQNIDEENTRGGLIEPVFILLGYDIHNTEEVIKQYPIDNSKIDYAIKQEQLIIGVEAKRINQKLQRKERNQSITYIACCEPMRLIMLTNGETIEYYKKNENNTLSSKPFYTTDMKNPTYKDVLILNKLHKNNINIDVINNIDKFEVDWENVSEHLDAIKEMMFEDDTYKALEKIVNAINNGKIDEEKVIKETNIQSKLEVKENKPKTPEQLRGELINKLKTNENIKLIQQSTYTKICNINTNTIIGSIQKAQKEEVKVHVYIEKKDNKEKLSEYLEGKGINGCGNHQFKVKTEKDINSALLLINKAYNKPKEVTNNLTKEYYKEKKARCK